MPSSTSDSWVRIWPCWCAGKTSMMRLIVWAAELVCSVANVKWPVSAMRSAASIVSRSRISPMSTTSGSSRRAARRAIVKLVVSLCTSRWFTRQPLWLWMYSIGSSMVRMCSARSVLILSSIAASVVDLPEPVGPVTRTRPRGRSASLASTAGGAALREHVAAEAAGALDAEREVELEGLLEALLLGVRAHAVDQLLGLGRRHRRQVQPLQLAVDADLRRRVGGDVQIRSAQFDGRLEELWQRWQRHSDSVPCKARPVPTGTSVPTSRAIPPPRRLHRRRRRGACGATAARFSRPPRRFRNRRGRIRTV